LTYNKNRNTLQELLSSGSGKAGTFLLAILLIISLIVIITYPADFGLKYWSNPVLWADNPKVAPPIWTNYFSTFQRAETQIFETNEPSMVSDKIDHFEANYVFDLEYNVDEPPSFTSITVEGITYIDRPPIITLIIERPDGKVLEIYTLLVRGPRPGEQSPFLRYFETPFRVQISGDPKVATVLSDFLKREFDLSIRSQDLLATGVNKAIFGTTIEGKNLTLLKGQYQIRVIASLYDGSDSINRIKIVLGGELFGLMGTDTLGRDLAVGLIFGFPIALFIGLVTASITTFIGTFMGIISGYFGGKIDTTIQRSSDILANLPLLPILIFLAFIIGQNLFVIILILIAFGWPGLTILIRSMVLQLRSGQLVESSITLGASPYRIMFRHIFPQTAPFVFAQMIFFTPAAILAEAALSFLGLGDPTLPTWGQLLEQGFRNGGVYVGYWWWIIPPGILIVITAMTFVLLALGMEPIINPRLRRRRN
jgi:peptide/nickel transport system permease protein